MKRLIGTLLVMLGFGAAAGCGASNKTSRTPEPEAPETRDTVVVREIPHVMLMYGVPRRDFNRQEAVEQPNGGGESQDRY